MDREIELFGRRLGIDGLAFNEKGMAQLDISGIGSFFLERSNGGRGNNLLMYLSAPLDTHDPAVVMRFFKLCDYRRNNPFRLSFGLFRGQAFLLSAMDERSVTASSIENALRFLADCFQMK